MRAVHVLFTGAGSGVDDPVRPTGEGLRVCNEFRRILECRRSQPGALPGGARSRASRRHVGRGMAADHLRQLQPGPAAKSGLKARGWAISASPAETPSLRGARLSETVARLNARLAQMTAGGAEPQGQGVFDRAFDAARRDHTPQGMPEPSDLGIDQVIAEIAARQRMLDEAPAAQARYAEPPGARFLQPGTAAPQHHPADRDAAPPVRPRGRAVWAAQRPCRHRPRHRRGDAAPRARSVAERSPRARRPDRREGTGAAAIPPCWRRSSAGLRGSTARSTR